MNYSQLIWLYRYLWFAPHLLLLLVAAVMFRRKLHKQYPIFFSYLIFEFLQFCVLYSMSYLKAPIGVYVKADLLDRIGGAVLHFGMIQELFAVALMFLGPVKNQMTRILRWVTIALIVLGSLFGWGLCYSSLKPGAFPTYWSIEPLQVAICALLFLVFLWHRFLGIRMPTLSFGIALGMGLVASVDLLLFALKMFIVFGSGMKYHLVNMAAYQLAVLIWLYFALVPEHIDTRSHASLPQLRKQAAELGRVAQL
ncbi:MAG TPA: hypothetical protein VL983_06645 [Terriglobales bacterium]|nr:hypothetical protein [Terriglobales bacterium]